MADKEGSWDHWCAYKKLSQCKILFFVVHGQAGMEYPESNTDFSLRWFLFVGTHPEEQGPDTYLPCVPYNVVLLDGGALFLQSSMILWTIVFDNS